jgi:hypothetical protein
MSEPKKRKEPRDVPWWGLVIAAVVVVGGIFLGVIAAQGIGADRVQEICELANPNSLDC